MASSVPDAWKIFDGRLYMFEPACVQYRWVVGGARKHIKAGDPNWLKIKTELSNYGIASRGGGRLTLLGGGPRPYETRAV